MSPVSWSLVKQEPLEPLLDVPLERVVAEPEEGRAVLDLLADVLDPAAVQEPEAQHLQLQQHVAADERGVGVVMADDDRRGRRSRS